MSYKQALQENNVDLQALLDAVNELPDQVSLPTLSNPASPSEILNGYEAIGADGAVIEGTALETASTATAADIMSGKTAYNSAGELLTGTASKGMTLYEYSFGLANSSGSATVSYSFSVASGAKYGIFVFNFTNTAYFTNGSRDYVNGTWYGNGGSGSIQSYSGSSLRVNVSNRSYVSVAGTLKVYLFK